jgi:hypothetical protein
MSFHADGSFMGAVDTGPELPVDVIDVKAAPGGSECTNVF